MNWQDAFNFGGSNAANSLASSYSQSSGLTDAFKSGGSTLLKDLASSYPEPSSTVPDDFFIYSPDKDSGIDWNTMIANPDVLQGIGDSYPDLFKDGVDFLKDFTSEEKSQYFDAQKAASNLPINKSDGWYQQVSPSVGLYGGFRGNNLVGNLASSYPYSGLSSPISNFGQLGVKDVVGAGARMAGQQLANKALYAINPVLGAVNQFYPGGATEAFKDVTRFAGGIGNTISKGVKSVVDWFCDERLKVDIAPLESTEVNDELAQMAFFVKGIRECS